MTSTIDMSQYERLAQRTSKPNDPVGVLNPILGICGESAEIAEKFLKSALKTEPGNGRTEVYLMEELKRRLGDFVKAGTALERLKKIIRDHKEDLPEGQLNVVLETIQGNSGWNDDNFALEQGDLLWYNTDLAVRTGQGLAGIATKNINKLESRAARGKIHGEGDNR